MVSSGNVARLTIASTLSDGAASITPLGQRPAPRGGRTGAAPGGRLARLIGTAALAAIVTWWTWRALHDPRGIDFRVLYRGGQLAWRTGHPERESTWISTPLLAAMMAGLTRLISLRAATDVITVVNLVLVLGTAAIVLRRVQNLLSPIWWWVAAFALLSFAPMMSTVWSKQLNVIALVLALAGFDLLRGDRTRPGAALIGLSVALKPLIFLLPLVLVVRRESRRAAAQSLAWIAALTIAGQAFLALRAHDLGLLNPLSALRNFVGKSQPGWFTCRFANFSPQSLLCRLAGPKHWAIQHVVVWIAVAVLGAWLIDALKGRKATSWEVFAFVCPLSVMLSPLAWSHYQIVLAPLFVLLLVGFTRQGAGIGAWVGLAAAFFLVSLMWGPYGTSIQAAIQVLSAHTDTFLQRRDDAASIATVAQFAQYTLVITGLLWYAQLRPHQAQGAADR